MKRTLLTIMTCAIALAAMAQKPHYLPGDGVYIVGLPADQSKTYDCPVMVAEAYQTTFKTTGAELASISAGKSYNVSKYLEADGTLNLISFMGCGQAKNLIVRNFDGESYSIGDYAPNKTWKECYIVAASPAWDGKQTYTLGVYDHWDCPVTYDADKMITEKKASGVTIDFGNPHEGLVCSNINFNLISESSDLKAKLSELTINLNVWDNDRKDIVKTIKFNLRDSETKIIGTTEDGKNIYSVYAYNYIPVILAQPFTVDIDGLDKLGADAWIPRAVDTHNLYPTHTTYHMASADEKVAESDACVNVEGYFNYVGTWGWYDGKCEYGECVAQGDYVQVYYDPSDPDWPGMYFAGEPTFPVECTYGAVDLIVQERPDWIYDIQLETSQWAEYGALLIIMQADAMPSEESGRYGKVVISTRDEASEYTIHVRQGNGQFPDAIEGPMVEIPVEGGMFDLSGRTIAAPQPGQVYIKNGKKFLKK